MIRQVSFEYKFNNNENELNFFVNNTNSYAFNALINNDTKFSVMAHKILNGHNPKEVMVVPKNIKKMGFFEKFFQLFS